MRGVTQAGLIADGSQSVASTTGRLSRRRSGSVLGIEVAIGAAAMIAGSPTPLLEITLRPAAY